MRRSDLIAGLSVAGLLLPEAVAYSSIAGLPPQRAVLAGIAGCLAYAAIGRSRFAIVSPTSSAAAILAATLAAMPAPAETKAAIATAAVLLTGVVFALAAIARLGGLTNLISRPVLRGFAFGIALTIILHQVPVVTGVPVSAPDIFRLAVAIARSAPLWHAASIAAGLVALVAFLLIRRLAALPGALIVLALGVMASRLLGLPAMGVATVGAIDAVPTWPTLPDLSAQDWSQLAQYVVPLVLILFAESWGTISALAMAHGDRVSPNRELGALGVANLASALVQGMPVGAGFSGGSAAELAGSTSRLTSVAAAVALTGLVIGAGPLVADLPEPVLAAVVIGTLAHALRPAPFLRLWHLRRDFPVAIGAAFAVLAFGVLNGMLLAVALSLALVIRRMAAPRVARLGRLADSHDFVDMARHPDAAAPPGMAIWRPAEQLFFANAESVLEGVETGSRADPGLRAVILSLEECADLDSSALDALVAFDTRLATAGIRLTLARVHDHVRDVLTAGAATDLLTRSTYSVDDAVTETLRALAQEPSHAP